MNLNFGNLKLKTLLNIRKYKKCNLHNEFCKRNNKNCKCDSHLFSKTNTTKYLGLHIDDCLKWDVPTY